MVKEDLLPTDEERISEEPASSSTDQSNLGFANTHGAISKMRRQAFAGSTIDGTDGTLQGSGLKPSPSTRDHISLATLIGNPPLCRLCRSVLDRWPRVLRALAKSPVARCAHQPDFHHLVSAAENGCSLCATIMRGMPDYLLASTRCLWRVPIRRGNFWIQSESDTSWLLVWRFVPELEDGDLRNIIEDIDSHSTDDSEEY